ncbi:hypothetical protein PENTCL1PPCAC_6112, partial [Pristionchus entomophagus]
GRKMDRSRPSGLIRVGKVQYDEKDLLGSGSMGTKVFRGNFDGREVAVKRMYQDFLPPVDREALHLRKSDSHANVIRYFCTESDHQYRYLVLELCEASLKDFVEKKLRVAHIDLSREEILRQMTEGLAHLHSIKIVHRDLKPQNVLISTRGRTRVMISDFGLSKRINHGKDSLTNTSEGVAGTDGWIAPEELNKQRTSFPMDIFSLGCLFFYVLTMGSHPYGEQVHRNSNIVKGIINLQPLDLLRVPLQRSLSSHLISLTLHSDPNGRPSAKSILAHPFFWTTSKQLGFFCDVSDWLEDKANAAKVIRQLQNFVFSDNSWIDRICHSFRGELIKFRMYNGSSVRDLLRAMRNTKHHYRTICRKLSENDRSSLGEVPDDCIVYFTTRFPALLLHVYTAIELCANEDVFKSYYSDEVRARVIEQRQNEDEQREEMGLEREDREAIENMRIADEQMMDQERLEIAEAIRRSLEDEKRREEREDERNRRAESEKMRIELQMRIEKRAKEDQERRKLEDEKRQMERERRQIEKTERETKERKEAAEIARQMEQLRLETERRERKRDENRKQMETNSPSHLDTPGQGYPSTSTPSTTRQRDSSSNLPEYKTRLCNRWFKGECTRHSQCHFAHGNNELRINDQSIFCTNFLPGGSGSCSFGERCKYIHPTDFQ